MIKEQLEFRFLSNKTNVHLTGTTIAEICPLDTQTHSNDVCTVRALLDVDDDDISRLFLMEEKNERTIHLSIEYCIRK